MGSFIERVVQVPPSEHAFWRGQSQRERERVRQRKHQEPGIRNGVPPEQREPVVDPTGDFVGEPIGGAPLRVLRDDEVAKGIRGNPIRGGFLAGPGYPPGKRISDRHDVLRKDIPEENNDDADGDQVLPVSLS